MFKGSLKQLTIKDLSQAFEFVNKQSYKGHSGKSYSGFYEIGEGSPNEKPFLILAQLHGNEPAGVAAHILCMQLAEQGLLKKKVLLGIGNQLAAKQYYEHYLANTNAKQEDRDFFRRGVDNSNNPLCDLNRIPDGYKYPDGCSYHSQRARELIEIAPYISGILDIHSARGDLTCVTTTNNNEILKGLPINKVLVGLSAAIGSLSGSNTLKTLMAKHIKDGLIIGIEAGTHEGDNTLYDAVDFVEKLLINMDIIDGDVDKSLQPTYLRVGKKLSFNQLENAELVKAGEIINTYKNGKQYYYNELEYIEAGQVVAVSSSGVQLKAKENFYTLFVAKSGELYADKAVVPLPIEQSQMHSKFCYPCILKDSA